MEVRWLSQAESACPGKETRGRQRNLMCLVQVQNLFMVMTLPTGKHDLMAPWNPINHISDFLAERERSWDLEAVILRMHGASFAFTLSSILALWELVNLKTRFSRFWTQEPKTQKESLSLSGWYFYPPKSVSYLGDCVLLMSGHHIRPLSTCGLNEGSCCCCCF